MTTQTKPLSAAELDEMYRRNIEAVEKDLRVMRKGRRRVRTGCSTRMNKNRTGSELIAEERQRQINVEGWTAEHDENHKNGELAKAAACYALAEQLRIFRGFIRDDPSCPFEPNPRIHEIWPWDQKWWKPSNRVRNLVKAGALIAAEIDRLRKLRAR